MKKILFVCLGNICRSSTAEGVMLHLIKEAGLEEEFVIDSAGIVHTLPVVVINWFIAPVRCGQRTFIILI